MNLKPTETSLDDLPQDVKLEDDLESARVSSDLGNLAAGDACPNYQKSELDYDGLLYLTCAKCGYRLGGCFT